MSPYLACVARNGHPAQTRIGVQISTTGRSVASFGDMAVLARLNQSHSLQHPQDRRFRVIDYPAIGQLLPVAL